MRKSVPSFFPVRSRLQLLLQESSSDWRLHVLPLPDGQARCVPCNLQQGVQATLRNHARQPPGLLRMLLHCHRVINEFAFRSHLIAKHGIRGVSKPTQLYGEGRLTAAAGESTGGGPNHANRSSDVRLHTYRPQRQTIHIVTHVTVLVKNKLRVPISSSAVL